MSSQDFFTACNASNYLMDKRNVTLLGSDKVHLTDLGNDILLFRLQQALQAILSKNISVSPPTGEFGPWQYLI